MSINTISFTDTGVFIDVLRTTSRSPSEVVITYQHERLKFKKYVYQIFKDTDRTGHWIKAQIKIHTVGFSKDRHCIIRPTLNNVTLGIWQGLLTNFNEITYTLT